MSDSIGILGAGGQADEAESYLSHEGVAFRAVSQEYVGEGLLSVESPGDEYKALPVIAAIGAPKVRRLLVEQWPGKNFASIISRDAAVDKSASIAEGCLIAPGAVITTNVQIGAHTIVNVGATLSHDVITGSFVTISPGATILGKVRLEDGVFVGAGAVIKNGVSIASGAVIGAGAVVLHDITQSNSVYVGIPAKQISENDDWLEKV